jgi:CHAT domain-containing protein
MTSIGLDFAEPNAHGLQPLLGAVAEAATVAAAFGAQPVAEPDATEKRVAEALENSRFVHLATHGRHNVDSPAFQCMYFTPDAGSDGILYAHEILGYDLRGLDLLTMSACETALGRFDLSDNARGLPAAMLLSGVSTLIGTLWQVEDTAATGFFECLYRRLESGEPCLDAFRRAQNDTRSQHREYRDWGAFYMVGDWDW